MRIKIKLPNVSRYRKSYKSIDNIFTFFKNDTFRKFAIMAIPIALGLYSVTWIVKSIYGNINSFAKIVSTTANSTGMVDYSGVSTMILSMTIFIVVGMIILQVIRTFYNSYSYY